MTAKAYQARRVVDLLAGGGVADRVAATADGVTMAMQQINLAMLAAGTVAGRTVTKLVAASDASAAAKNAADYVCTGIVTGGIGDEVQINAALTSLGSVGGRVLLSEGTFILGAQVQTTAAKQAIRGMGMGATTLKVVDSAGSGINTTTCMVYLGHDDCEVSDLTVDGNKTGGTNGSQTNARLVGTVVSISRPLIRRVRALNSPGYGFVVQNNAQGVIRDCIADGTAVTGMTLRGSASQPLVASGCTAKGSGSVGITCDSGPVNLSDCHALGNTSYGFVLSSGPLNLSQCAAESNGSYGFNISGTAVHLEGCRATSNVTHGFFTTGARTRFVGCVAQAASGEGFRTAVGATDAFYSGCWARDMASGFVHVSTGRATYVDCSALASAGYGFYASDGTVSIQDCTQYGTVSSSGIYLPGGTDHQVRGCRVANNGGYGIVVGAAAQRNVAIVGNVVSDSSLATHLTYPHIHISAGADGFIHGNSFEILGSGNRAPHCINLGNIANTAIGVNDYANGFMTGAVIDAAVAPNYTRRASKLQLDYRPTVLLLDTTALTGGVWRNVCSNQSFRVDQAHSLIEIVCGGFMMVGIGSSSTATRLVIDDATYVQQGCETIQAVGAGYQNPLSGGHVALFQGTLAVGSHTVRVEVKSLVNTTAYLRTANPQSDGAEFLSLLVTEFFR